MIELPPQLYLALDNFPTDSFTTLKLQNPSHDVSELYKICRSSDAEAIKLRKDPLGESEEESGEEKLEEGANLTFQTIWRERKRERYILNYTKARMTVFFCIKYVVEVRL